MDYRYPTQFASIRRSGSQGQLLGLARLGRPFHDSPRSTNGESHRITNVEPLPSGTLLHGRYRLVRLIGQGGMGAVYEAVDHLLENTVAVKQMLLSGTESDRAFEHEAKVLASLRHPALPVVIDFFLEDSGAFLVMQYIEGDDLSRFVQQQGSGCPMSDVIGQPPATRGILQEGATEVAPR